ncbi:hypothetical protein SGRIM128S_05243 [Streptomyces griseomycini]
MTSHCRARSSLPPAKSRTLRGTPAESAATTRSETASRWACSASRPSSRTAVTPQRAVASSRAPAGCRDGLPLRPGTMSHTPSRTAATRRSCCMTDARSCRRSWFMER